MNRYFITAWCKIGDLCYHYSYKIKAVNDAKAIEKVCFKFEKWLRIWFNDEINQERKFKIDTKIIKRHEH